MSKKEAVKSNNNVVYSRKCHAIWCPKCRRPVVADVVQKRLKDLIRRKAKEFKADVIELEVMPDHMHLLAEIDP